MKNWLLLPLLLLLVACSRTDTSTAGLQLEAHRGQWLVINYWAVWCAPCIQEIPELNALNELPEVTVLGVNYDGVTGEELERQLQTLGIDFPLLETDPASQLGVTRPVVLPTTLIIDPSGQLQETLVGPQTLDSLAAATGQSAGSQSRE